MDEQKPARQPPLYLRVIATVIGLILGIVACFAIVVVILAVVFWSILKFGH